MNRILTTILLVTIFILFGAVGCAKKSVPVKSTENVVTDYSDDLSKYRMRHEAPKSTDNSESQEVLKNEALVSENDISAELNIVLDSISAKNKVLGFLPGYTILVYSGNSRTEADRVRNRLFDIAGDQDIRDLQYELPTYFVKVGQYHEQIEAQKLYLEIRLYYPDATIVPEKFELKDESKEDN